MTNNNNTQQCDTEKAANSIPLSSKDLRKYAEEVREHGRKLEEEKLVKCAKYVLGMTALAQLHNELRSL